ncbi:DUF3040 domain-containing protein [Streptomyces avidinii]|uniref:DUF3040 domain-containing protein n=1 Tax=Streptomyces avidinii TaxID=1895 RepID=UPI0037B6BF38
MDEERALAEIERCLARDDPELATRITTLNEQFPQACVHSRPRWSRRKAAVVVLVIVALLGLILTALLAKPPPSEEKPVRPVGLAAAVSVQVHRHGRRSRRRPGNGEGGGLPASYPKGAHCVCVILLIRTPRIAWPDEPSVYDESAGGQEDPDSRMHT